MRALLILGIFVVPFTGLAQVAGPSDPMEPVTGGAENVTTAEQRASIVALKNRAAEKYALHAKGTPAHILQISFNATSSTLFPGGAGQLRESWISGQNWRWDATLGNYSLLRISSNGVAYDQQAPRPIPLRLKMLASAVFAPIQATARLSAIRTASVTWKGTPVTCILLSFAGNAQSAPASPGRQWEETEYCIDPASGLLNVFSEVPGIYISYDYGNALQFHGRSLPGAVTITENGTAVVQAQLTSIVDTDPANLTLFTPTASMMAQGPAVVLGGPMRMPRIVPSKDIQPGTPIESAIVHVILDEQGNVQESEVLQSSSVSAQALESVAQMKWFAASQPAGAPPREREAYVRVEFVPAQAGGQSLHP